MLLHLSEEKIHHECLVCVHACNLFFQEDFGSGLFVRAFDCRIDDLGAFLGLSYLGIDLTFDFL